MQVNNLFQKLTLSVTAGCLVVLAFSPGVNPELVHAQEQPEASCGIYLETGTTMIRTPVNDLQVMGKVAVNTCNGQVWGFPTTTAAPYPLDTTTTKPPVPHPVYLSNFDMDPLHR